MKEDKPGWQKAKHVERVSVKYEPKNKLPNHKATLPNQIEKEVQALTSAICVTNEANQNLMTWAYCVPTCPMVNSYRMSEDARKFQGSDQP